VGFVRGERDEKTAYIDCPNSVYWYVPIILGYPTEIPSIPPREEPKILKFIT